MSESRHIESGARESVILIPRCCEAASRRMHARLLAFMVLTAKRVPRGRPTTRPAMAAGVGYDHAMCPMGTLQRENGRQPRSARAPKTRDRSQSA